MNELLNSAPRSDVFCDYLRFTVPLSDKDALENALQEFIQSLGCAHEQGFYRSFSGGTLSIRACYGVIQAQVTGQFLHDLRQFHLYERFLFVVATLQSYRLTQAHLTLDVSIEGSEYMTWYYEQVRSGLIRIGRKLDVLKDVTKYMSPSFRNPSLDTGTVYLGSKHAERRLKVYDKAQERFSNASVSIPPTVRFEIHLSAKTGVTIADLVKPRECFYHFVPPEVIKPPEGLQGWKPSEAIGAYTVERSQAPTAYQRATRLLESIEPTLKSISKLSREHPERQEAFRDLIMSRINRVLVSV